MVFDFNIFLLFRGQFGLFLFILYSETDGGKPHQTLLFFFQLNLGYIF